MVLEEADMLPFGERGDDKRHADVTAHMWVENPLWQQAAGWTWPPGWISIATARLEKSAVAPVLAASAREVVQQSGLSKSI